jgi:hypothetical protein
MIFGRGYAALVPLWLIVFSSDLFSVGVGVMSELDSQSESAHPSRHDLLRFYGRKLQRHPAVAAWRHWARNVRSVVPATWKLATRQYRVLPSAVVIGAQKAGTTQLYSYVTTHPRVFPASHKEINYFTTHVNRPVDWYRSHFPLRRSMAAVGGLSIDASPSYMPVPQALRSMHAVLPQAKIIAILRDPVSRAFSHYQHAKTRGREPRSFEQAVEDELRDDQFPPRLGIALAPDAGPLLGYVARGYYALQLELALALYPREQVLIIDSGDLFRDTGATCQRVFAFLGVEPHAVQPGKVYNRGYYKETVDPRVAERLREHFRPYDELLSQLVGHTFRWMGHKLAA